MKGRFTLYWLDTSLIALWLSVFVTWFISVLIQALKAQRFYEKLVEPLLPDGQQITLLIGLVFVAVTAARLLSARGHTQWILPVAIAISYGVTKVVVRMRIMEEPRIGSGFSAALAGVALSMTAALLPRLDTVQGIWSRIKPAGRPVRPRPNVRKQ